MRALPEPLVPLAGAPKAPDGPIKAPRPGLDRGGVGVALGVSLEGQNVRRRQPVTLGVHPREMGEGLL
eukprot:11806549-Alexandrium_andersonii.AAC.1